MKKKAPILISGVILILAIIVGFNKFSNKDSKNTLDPTDTSPTAITENQNTKSNLRELISSESPKTCTFRTEETSGQVYIANGKLRGVIEATGTGQSSKTNMIILDGMSYIWMDDQKTGFKMNFDVNATPQTEINPINNQGFDPAVLNNYTCNSWTPDNSQFDLPTDITFESFTSPQ